MLSNAVMTDAPSSANKESSECVSNNFQLSTDTDIAEKSLTTNFPDEKEKPPISAVANSQLSETVVTETESKVDVDPPESVVIPIQASIRGFMVCLHFESTIQNSHKQVTPETTVLHIPIFLVSFRLRKPC